MSFLDSHPFRGAFIANRLERVAELIVRQGEALLREGGVEFPPRAASAVLVIGERGAMSAADIAKALAQPHQLVTQRIELLVSLGIVEREPDSGDARRSLVRFTRKGAEQYRRLKHRLAHAADAFAALFAEIECDLDAAIERMSAALERASLVDRVTAAEARNTKRASRR